MSDVHPTPPEGAPPAGAQPPATEAAVTERVAALLARMTAVEKAAQLTQYFYFTPPPGSDAGPRDPDDPPAENDPTTQAVAVDAALARGGVGSLLFVTDPAQINRLQRRTIEGNRLGIPALFGFDVVHGLRTIFPVPIAMAASWDPELIEQGQAAAAREARAVGIHWTFAPMVDIARDPRWGRMVEGAGEDPYLGAVVAAAQVRGFQGDRLGAPGRVVAGVKHLAGYGAALGGRDYDEVDLSDSQLWNVYLPPFHAAVEAGVGTVMTAYMSLNGVPATANRWLLADVLRGAWGFRGFVVSDANAVRNLLTHHLSADPQAAAVAAVSAGVDLEMAMADPSYATLPAAVAAGALDEAVLDAAAARILEVKVRLGLFEQPYVDEDAARAVLADPTARELARTAAQRSAVLLRNEGLLPLRAESLDSVAVLGPLADSRRDILGPWAFDFDLDDTVTVLQGIRDLVGDRVRVEHARGVALGRRTFPSMFDTFPGNTPVEVPGFDEAAEFDRAVHLAADSDVAVVVAGEWQHMSGEGASRSALDLPGRQLELLQAVVATGTPTVLVLMNGRPLDLRWPAVHVPAILDVFHPGSRGGAATADLLFGVVEPVGRLPFSWPRSVGQVPLLYAHTRSHEPENQQRRYWDEASTPLFPFGFGLGYARFACSDLVLDRTQVAVDGAVTATVTVTNVSDRDGEEVVQLYLHQRSGSAVRPVCELKGFQRVRLAAGATGSVRFEIGPEQRRYWSGATRDWALEAARFDVWVGTDSTAELHAGFDTR